MKILFLKISSGFALGTFVFVMLATGQAYAQTGTRKFLGREITPGAGLYLVAKDANVRAGPETSARKVGSVSRGGRVDVAGKAKGGAGWMAVRRGAPAGGL